MPSKVLTKDECEGGFAFTVPIKTIMKIGLKLSQKEDLKWAMLMTQAILAQTAYETNSI